MSPTMHFDPRVPHTCTFSTVYYLLFSFTSKHTHCVMGCDDNLGSQFTQQSKLQTGSGISIVC